MKRNLLCAFILVTGIIRAQQTNSGSGWSAKFETQKVFIENKGQWDGKNNLPSSNVLFASDFSEVQFLFSKTGLTYKLTKVQFPDKDERHEREYEMKEELMKGKSISHKEMEQEEARPSKEVDYVQMEWVNANPNVLVVAEEEVSHYYTYNVNHKNVGPAKAFKKIIYKNLYPDIDVEYVFHPVSGIEYSFVLHPGADASQIQMKYSDVGKIWLDGHKNLHLKTQFGDITEHAPKSFYQNSSASIISSAFVRNGNAVNFSIASYDKTQTVIIDPWVQTPAFASQWDCVWECERDGLGNVYIIGGVTPMQLLKYNSTGGLQWTHSTPYDTTSWLGTFATDDAGNSYVTQGSLAEIEKVNTSGGVVWSNNSPGGIFSSTEFWSISFNCDQTKLVIGGTGDFLPPRPYIYQVDMANGNVTSSIRVTGGALFPTQEVRSITHTGNGKYYFVTHDSIGYLNQNFGVCSNPQSAKYYTDNTYHLSYQCENYRYNNTGIPIVKAFGGYVYTVKGTQLHKRNFQTAAIIATATIPGGAFATGQVRNSGIDIDVNGNIYVGSNSQVVKFDANLNQLATYATTNTMNVYDVHVSTAGNIIACGTTGTYSSGARQGYIEQWAVSSGNPIAITCCDASICFAGPFCTTDGAVTLTASTPGGVWTGTGITNPTTGVFNPATAGQGTHYIVNTIGCGSDSIPITVNICASLTACLEQNGSITVSGGSPTYTWYEQDTTQNCSSCIIGCIFPPGCAVTSYTWQQFSTGINATPPEFPVRVTDGNANELVIASTGGLASCSACALSASGSSTNAGCSNTGTASVNVTGGTGASTFIWSNGATAQSLSNLAAGTYTVTVTNGGCTATASAVVTATNNLSSSASNTSGTCASGGSATANPTGGTGSFSYQWNNAATSQTISNLTAGIYTVTVTSGNCTATASTTVSNTNNLSTSASSTQAGCTSGGTATASAGGGTGSYTYLWSNTGTTQTISNLAAGTYNVTVTSGSCTATATTTVTSSGAGLTLTPSTTSATCGNNNGGASISATGGNGTYTYLWSTGASTSAITNLPPATYTVTVTSSGCTATASIAVGNSNAVTAAPTSTNASCSANSGSATANAGGGNGTFTYAWSNSGNTATISNLAPGTYTVTVTSNGCSVTASVSVGTSNGVTLTSTSTNTSCGNNNGTASVTATGGSGSYTYSWSNSATTSSLSNLAAGNYTVTVNDGAGCTATASMVVGPSGNNQVTVASDKSIMCSGDSAQVCAPAGYTSYIWNTGQTTQCISTTLAGNYWVTVTDAGSCTATSNHVPVNVYPLPPVSIVVNGDTLSSFGAVTYQWIFNGTPVPGATDSIFIASQGGSYTLLITDNNGCFALSLPVIISGIDELSRDVVSVYPNPNTEGKWTLSVGKAWLGATYDVYDDEGRIVFKSEIRNPKSEIYFDAASAVYMLRISSGNKTVNVKLIKM